VLGSGGLALLLIVLFRHERSRGARYHKGARALFDRSLEVAKSQVKRRYRSLADRTLPQSIQYIFHRMLVATLSRLQRLETAVSAVLRRNKNRANRRDLEEASNASSHLSAIADHKRETALSEEEKKQRRDHALNGH
jgi:hypothetical protein